MGLIRQGMSDTELMQESYEAKMADDMAAETQRKIEEFREMTLDSDCDLCVFGHDAALPCRLQCAQI